MAPERRRRERGGTPGRRPAGTAAAGPAQNGRELARHVLARVEQDGAFASRMLASALDRAPHLDPPERGLATELVYGVLRRRARLDRALEAVADRGLASLDPDMRILLRVGAYQLLFLDRVPAYAAVHDTVETAKRIHGPKLAGLTNALLRRVAERGEPPLPDPARDPLGHLIESCGFPQWLARLTLRELGAATAVALANELSTPAPISLRANRLAGVTRERLMAALAEDRPGATLEPSPIAPDGVVARGLDGPARTAAFEHGAFAIVDAGAQVTAELCGAAPGERILDACAGMGGKTCHLAALGDNRAEVVAVDLSPAKLEHAREQARRLGAANIDTRVVNLTEALPAEMGLYDRVLLDAPCSGLGVLRRHPELLLRRLEGELPALAETQRRMLDVVAERVKPGGLLTYAVCTFERAECEDVVGAFLKAHPQFRVDRPPAREGGVPWERLLDAAGYVRTWPHRDDADAFFAVRMRRVPDGAPGSISL